MKKAKKRTLIFVSILQELREQYIELFIKKELYDERRKRLLQMDGFPEVFIRLLNEFNLSKSLVNKNINGKY